MSDHSATTLVAERPVGQSPPSRRRGSKHRASKSPTHHGFGFRPEIEGLRAIAVLGVVLYHAGVVFLPGGYVGVDVFFVLSGYLITGLMLTEVAGSGRLSLRDFYARRIRRLLPAAVLVLVVTAAACAVVLPVTQRAEAAADIRAAGLYVSNWRFAAQATDYLADTSTPSPVLHYWSLGVEEQFYILWPVLIVGCLFALRWNTARRSGTTPADVRTDFPSARRTLGATITLIAVVSLLWGIALTPDNESLAFFNTFTRIWELAFGALIAVVGSRVLVLTHAVRGVLAWVGFLGLMWCLFRYNADIPYPGRAALLPVASTVLILVGCSARQASPAPGPARVLAAEPLRHIGRISYSWYLWHWPLLVLPAVALGHALNFGQAVVAVLASYLLALASYHLVERRVRFATTFRASRPAMALGVALTAVALVAASGLTRSATRGVQLTGTAASTAEVSTDVFVAGPGVTVDTRSGDVSTPTVLTPSALEAPGDLGEMQDRDCQAHLLDVQVKECVFGDPTSDHTVVIFGDSHATAWTAALEVVAIQRGWKLVTMTKGSCGPGTYSVYDDRVHRAFRECDTWRHAALDRMREIKPDLVIMGGRWWSFLAGPDGAAIRGEQTQPAVAHGTAAMARKLTKLGAPVVFLRDWPAPGFDAPTCVAEHKSDYSACDFSRADRLPQDAATLTAVDAVPGVTIVDITEAICPAAAPTCPSVAQNILRYRDDSHISATYSRTLAPLLLDALPSRI